ncbi:hypothetical protein CANINC_001902 [Pichia inconspicua]|uniref:Vps72/YL1 C-terminal domain-containing protein n=1 Tax=Pichia inconspicua TaxID=52247 RepID=A0A4T0X2H8_9ASCO|nr:hypothetical protein CANINC_001902 [[Candida] inconspicua]
MSSDESGNDSDSEPEFESIIATRARRSNAGSRLRQLLDLEETNAGLQAVTEDDENINLLFQEDEEDLEFRTSSDDENGAETEGEKINNDESGRQSITKRKREHEASEDEKNDSKIMSDEMLSNSDISASDSDEEEGEKELQRQERLKKRRKRNTGLTITAHKTKHNVKTSSEHKTSKSLKKVGTAVTSIEPHERRHSRRTATIQSSIATHEKLEKELEKRQVTVPIARKEYVEKTLEERLEEAKVTEKENMLSLTRFYEQEIQKKKKQRDLANSRKFRIARFLRFWSTGVYITPFDEVAEIEEEKRIQQEEEEKKQRRKLAYLKRKQTKLGITDDSLVLAELNRESKETELHTNTELKNEMTVYIGEGEVHKTNDVTEVDSEGKDQTRLELNNKNSSIGEGLGEIELDSDKRKNLENVPICDIKGTPNDTLKEMRIESNVENSAETKGEIGIKEITPQHSVEEASRSISDHVAVNEGESQNIQNVDTHHKLVYEGPALKVARSYLIFEEFDEKLDTDEIKTHLFGRQSLLTGNRRDLNTEPVLVIKRDESSNLDLQKIHEARKESLDALLKLPKFGETIVQVADDHDKSSSSDTNEVNIHTPAPIGIHLPDGNKKMCLITGTPAVYYDPSTGIPYSTVDSFKIIKAIIDGEYDWIQPDEGGINSRIQSGVGFYAPKNNKRHANGVPEGF